MGNNKSGDYKHLAPKLIFSYFCTPIIGNIDANN